MKTGIAIGIAAITASVATGVYTGELGNVSESIFRSCIRSLATSGKSIELRSDVPLYCKAAGRILIWQKGGPYLKRAFVTEYFSNIETDNPLMKAMAKRMVEMSENGEFDQNSSNDE